MSARPLVICLLGPTASGKTDLAIALRERLPVDLISVDSAMVYRGMDIGTAKPDPATLAAHPHQLVDIRDPAESYSAADFADDARAAIAASVAAGRIPLLVGGTMFYFRALLDGLAPMPASEPTVRAAIEAEAAARGWPALHAELAAVDPATASALHPNHSQRIARALEVYRLSGVPLSEWQRKGKNSAPEKLDLRYNVVQWILSPPDRAQLHARIGARFERMLELGLVDEVSRLYQRGDLHADLPALRAVGYRQVWRYLDGASDWSTMVAQGNAATRQLAKRQFTWLRRWPTAHWLESPDGGAESLAHTTEVALKFLPKAVI